MTAQLNPPALASHEIREVRQKAKDVKAVQVTADNGLEAAVWCGGRVSSAGRVFVPSPDARRLSSEYSLDDADPLLGEWAGIGDWIIEGPEGYRRESPTGMAVRYAIKPEHDPAGMLWLDIIEDAAAAATAAPWEADLSSEPGIWQAAPGGQIVIGNYTLNEAPAWADGSRDDLVFISIARNSIDALTAAVRAGEKQRKLVAGMVGNWLFNITQDVPATVDREGTIRNLKAIDEALAVSPARGK